MLISIFWLGFALAASPGPDFFLITSNTLSAGRSMGYLTLAGNRASLLVHISVAVLGLALILHHSQLLYLLVSVLGGGYLAFLGWKRLGTFFKFKQSVTMGQDRLLSPGVAFRQGFWTNLFNPKVSLFFFSLFPQFTSTDLLQGSPITIALIFFVGNTVWWVPLIFVVGYPRLRSVMHTFQRWLDFAFGLVFIYCGIRIFHYIFTKHGQLL